MISLEKNSIKVLEYRFMIYLMGINTQKEKFGSVRQKEYCKNSILSFVKERILEKKLDNNLKIWKIFLEIQKLDFDNLARVEEIYASLYNLSGKKSSKYFKLVGKESK
jgi:hypothetical protein